MDEHAVNGLCPTCGHATLVLAGAGDRAGDIRCLAEGCPRPTSVTDLLSSPHDHYVTFRVDETSRDWSVQHSLPCRLSGRMAECEYHQAIKNLVADGAVLPPELLEHPKWRIASIDANGMPFLDRVGFVDV